MPAKIVMRDQSSSQKEILARRAPDADGLAHVQRW